MANTSKWSKIVKLRKCTKYERERSGSVVECLTRDRRVAGSSLTGVTVLWSLSKTHYWFDPGRSVPITERVLMGRKESKQKQNMKLVQYCIGSTFCAFHAIVNAK